MDSTTWQAFIDLIRIVADGDDDTFHVIFHDGKPVVYPFAYQCGLVDPGFIIDHKPDRTQPLIAHGDSDCALCQHLFSHFPTEWELQNLDTETKPLHALVVSFNLSNDVKELIQADLLSRRWQEALEPHLDLAQYSDDELNAEGADFYQETLRRLQRIDDLWTETSSAWIGRNPDPWSQIPHHPADLHYCQWNSPESNPSNQSSQQQGCEDTVLWDGQVSARSEFPNLSSHATYWDHPTDSGAGCDVWTRTEELVGSWASTTPDHQEPPHWTNEFSFPFISVDPSFSGVGSFLHQDFAQQPYFRSSTPPAFQDPDFPFLLLPNHPDGSADLTEEEQTNQKKRLQKRKSNIPMAIVIHAGAGYHSLQNESFHLAMCSKAASEGMKLLKAGRTAVEAVEAAIKVLENNEITNAGYGSNLSIDGTVECDATMVDHFGRSGACGAVPNVKNPISLAKLILETSSQSLTLRRVPPNFLVGEGAKLFAVEHGMSTVTNEQLTSRNAKDRYTRWRADLDKIRGVNSVGTQVNVVEGPSPPQAVQAQEHGQDQMMTTAPKAHQGSLRDHTSAIMTATWNEGQPDSPSSEFNIESPTPTTIYSTTPNKNGSLVSSAHKNAQRVMFASPAHDPAMSPATLPSKRVKTLQNERTRLEQGSTTWAPKAGLNHGVASLDGSPEGGPVADLSSTSNYSSHDSCSLKRRAITEMTAEPNDADLDLITDTMGAIAIDKWGNIAAGSSSGGIGMKHRGRTGPAALVGIGTVVIPYNEHDPDFKTVAAVTSGTGEHMATTMAAAKCAERLYQGTMKGPTGRDVEEDDTAVIMQSFVENDFMGHPGVRNQTSARAIGVMAVEVNEKGVYLHWAHNTDSFALASFNLKDKVPHTCMSRLPEGSSVNVGARKLSNGDQIFD